jgi:hypothetical protein
MNAMFGSVLLLQKCCQCYHRAVTMTVTGNQKACAESMLQTIQLTAWCMAQERLRQKTILNIQPFETQPPTQHD